MAQNRNIGAQGEHSEVDIDFFALLRYMRQAWRFILICMLLSFTITACGLRNATPIYEASMVVAPIGGNDNASSGGSGVQSLNSVLSSLGGGSGSSPQFDQFQYKMSSPSVVRAANADGRLYAWLYPGLWNPQTRTWIKPSGMQQTLLGLVRAFFHKPDWIEPNDVMASDALKKQIVFETIPRSTLTLVSYQNSDRTIATTMLQRLFAEADRQIRNQERRRLKAQIENANDVLATTQVSDYRIAMIQVLANSQYRLMNVPDNIDYSARQVEAPFVSALPVAPKIGLSLALAVASAFLLSAFLAVSYRIVAAEMNRRGTPILDGANMTLRNLLLFAGRKYRAAHDGIKR